MKILVTGAAGFVGKNLCEALKNIRDGKDRRFLALSIEEIFRYTRESTSKELERWCALTPEGEELMKEAFHSLGLTARSHDRILRVGVLCGDPLYAWHPAGF